MTTLRNEDRPLPGHDDVGVPHARVRASERVTNAQLLEALGVAVYMTDAAGVITDYNEAAVALWGRRPRLYEDLWCGSWRLFWPDGSPMEHGACPMAITLKENRPVRGAEAIAERPDGSRVWFVPYPTPLRDSAGEVVGAVNVLVDITDRKLAAQNLIEKDARLTEALAIKDEFLGLVSHELKTPVTTILGNAQVLQRHEDRLPADVRDGAVDDLVRESERLHAIIDNLLVLARVGAAQQDEPEPIVIGRVVDACVRHFRRKCPQRVFTVDNAAGQTLVSLDATIVEQILSNLLSNAAKYSPVDAPIHVRVAREQGVVGVHVLDSGPGIALEEREKVLEPFFRSRATSTAASGVGVGLTVCRRLVEAAGGQLSVGGGDGGGADIGFTLPELRFDDER